MGADCLLLIAAALERNELEQFHSLAVEVGLDVLVGFTMRQNLPLPLTSERS